MSINNRAKFNHPSGTQRDLNSTVIFLPLCWEDYLPGRFRYDRDESSDDDDDEEEDDDKDNVHPDYENEEDDGKREQNDDNHHSLSEKDDSIAAENKNDKDEFGSSNMDLVISVHFKSTTNKAKVNCGRRSRTNSISPKNSRTAHDDDDDDNDDDNNLTIHPPRRLQSVISRPVITQCKISILYSVSCCFVWK